MAIYKDQFFLIDPSAPPAVGTALNFVRYTLNDVNNNNQFARAQGDTINGSVVNQSYPGDTVTVNVPGTGNVKYTGTTFYLANGQVVFTPNSGQILKNGTFVSSTFVTTQGPLTVAQLGPACFTLGTLIRTPEGEVAVECLKSGDLVATMDHGPQPLRWVGAQTVDATGAFAPVRFERGAMGNDRPLLVSPQHRMLWQGSQAELLFAQAEVLVPAIHLVGMRGVTRAPMPMIRYLHLLFDRHEIIFSAGVASESFHPGAAMLSNDRALRAEIATLFPECPALVPGQIIPAARQVLLSYEARLLAA